MDNGCLYSQTVKRLRSFDNNIDFASSEATKFTSSFDRINIPLGTIPTRVYLH